MKKTYIVLTSMAAFIISGCATHPMDPSINMKPPKYVEQMPSLDNEIPQNNPGSLFTNGDNLFSDTKAMKVNDIVTVVITEEVKQSTQASKKLSEANTDAGGLFDAGISGGVSVAGKNLSVAKTGFSVNLPSMNSSRTFQGSGTQQRNESFQTTVSARIVKVLKNGNYFISGTREIYVDGQKQIIQISGVIRPQDISSDNTIDSKYISDAKIAYKTEGDVKRYTEQNWFAKFWSAIAPW
ncbi:flagellar basal body L-ring protein FlgH [Nautilia sp.]